MIIQIYIVFISIIELLFLFTSNFPIISIISNFPYYSYQTISKHQNVFLQIINNKLNIVSNDLVFECFN